MGGAYRVSRPAKSWRTDNVGRVLFSATGRFSSEKLRHVNEGGPVAVTEVQMALFQNLDLGGTRLTDVAARASMTKQGMMELVDKAASLRLVERRPDPGDRRAKFIQFTPDGLHLLERLRRGVAQAEQGLIDATGSAFVGSMKQRLAAYVAEAGAGSAAGQDVADADSAWRAQNVGRVMSSATRVFVRDMLHRAREEGFEVVEEVQLALFRNLDLDGTRLTAIAARARMTKQAMLELVNKAEALGLVERLPDPRDQRAKLVAFTPLGCVMLERLGAGIVRAERHMARLTGEAFLPEMKARLMAYAGSDGSVDAGAPELVPLGNAHAESPLP